MKKSGLNSSLTIFLSLSLLLAACKPAATPQPTATTQPPVPTATPIPAPAYPQDQPVRATGSFTYTNGFVVETYYVEQAVALVDMHGFVTRDREWQIPVSGQTLGFLKVDPAKKSGEYQLDFPALPEGTFDQVGNDGQAGKGVQIYAIAYWPNLTGGPFSEGDDATRGWPTYLTSVVTDSENKDEITGGKLVVWVPDDKEKFPSGFGADNLLFTKDDPEMSLPAGYSVIDLNQKPFSILRDESPVINLNEPKDVAVKDYSKLSYTQAFDQMFNTLQKEYAFNGIAGKQPDWTALYSQLAPRVRDAEQTKNAQGFYQVLNNFANSFHDGHVGLSADQFASQAFTDIAGGGYGLAARQLDDGSVIVVYVLTGSPAENAGIKVGAQLIRFNQDPIEQAIAKVQPFTGSFSTDFALRYQQVRYLLRAAIGTPLTLEFTNPGDQAPRYAKMNAIDERQSFQYTSIYQGSDPNALPVEYRLLDSNIGYVQINSNYDDLNLIVRLFQRALKTFQDNKVLGVIIDLRRNSGGSPLGLAGFLTDKEIPLGQLEYYSDKTGKFEPNGEADKVTPNQEQYHFDKMALLVDQACFSACELEAYGFSQVPGMEVVGQYPTGGVEAEVSRGQFLLPEGMSLQAPTGRFILPDGSLFLEGKGVVPTLRVPITAATLLSREDAVLTAAQDAILKPAGAGVTPSAPPTLASQSEAETAARNGNATLEDRAREHYNVVSQAGQTYTYTIALNSSEPLIWANGWCASSDKILTDNLKHIKVKFTMDGVDLTADQLNTIQGTSGAQHCAMTYALVNKWPAGEHHLLVALKFDQKINDGAQDYPAGSHSYVYNVFIKP